jgi:hypothetical protein
LDLSACASGDIASAEAFGCGVEAWLTRARFLGGIVHMVLTPNMLREVEDKETRARQMIGSWI